MEQAVHSEAPAGLAKPARQVRHGPDVAGDGRYLFAFVHHAVHARTHARAHATTTTTRNDAHGVSEGVSE